MMLRPRPRRALSLSLMLCALALAAGAASAQRRAPRPGAKTAGAPAAQPAPPRLVVQYGHAEPIEGAAFSRDGRYAVTGSWGEGVAVLWDVEAGTEVRRFPGNERAGAQDGYMAVALSPDNRLVAAASETGVRVFDIRTGRVVQHLKDAEMGGELILINLDFSDDGARLTAGRQVFELATGRVVGPARNARSEVQRHDIETPDGRLSLEQARADGSSGDDERFNIIVKEKASGRAVATLGPHPARVYAMAVSRDGRTVLTGTDYPERALRVWDVETGAERHRLRRFTRPGTTTFTADAVVNAYAEGPEVRLRDWTTGRELVLQTGAGAGAAAVSGDGRRAVVVVGQETRVYDTLTGALVSSFPPPEDSLTTRRDRPFFSPDGRFVVGVNCHSCATALDEAETGRRLRQFKCNAGNPCHMAFSRDGRLVAVSNAESTGGAGHVEIYNIADNRLVARTRPEKDDYLEVNALAFSPDGRMVVTAGSDYTSIEGAQVKIWDAQTGRPLRELKGHTQFMYAVEWSADGRLIATASADGTARLWDARTGAEVRRLGDGSSPVREVRFAPDGRLVLTRAADMAVRLYEAETGRPVAVMLSFENGDWVVADSEGRFDTNNPEGIRGLHWVSPDDPLRTLPLEIFMRDYYEPRLLARLLAGERLGPVRALAQLNRAQPAVRIGEIKRREDDAGLVDVAVEVSKGFGNPSPAARGVYDLRLFRDGQLVGHAPDGGGEVGLDPRTGAATVVFKNVRLPRSPQARELLFTAYAFNEDRVKSATARARLDLPPAPSAARGRAYVVSVGVNAYDNADWDLRFAANDARRLQEVVAGRVHETGEYEETVRVALVSDYETRGGRKVEPRRVTESSATKENFRTVLSLLAGREVPAERVRAVPGAERLRAARPEDLVIITFSAHGYADERGRFYLFPSDTGAAREMRAALPRAVSSDELSAWLKDVDAGELVLVVDACHSAAGVQGEGFKPGPMGSRGLGQLSYDKGMRVLTSTQADDVALEFNLVEMGLLTYALTRDAVEAGRADLLPADRRITVSEWLAYGVERVPQLHAELESQLSEAGGRGPLKGDAQARVVRYAPRPRGPASRAARGLSAPAVRIQQPALFDFARRRRDAILVKR